MIVPTVGRIVWYHPLLRGMGVGDPGPDPRGQPLAAIVTHVWSDTCVNLTVHDVNGNTYGRTSVLLVQDGPVPDQNYAEWMPFQRGQAKKYDTDPANIADAMNPKHSL